MNEHRSASIAMFNADRWSRAVRRIRHRRHRSHGLHPRGLARGLGAFGIALVAAVMPGCAVTETSTAVADLDERDDERAALREIEIANRSLDPAVRRETPSPGAAGIGDPLFPTLGNGGYEVEHYNLRLRYATANPLQPIDGTALIIARATQALSRLNVDFGGDAVG